MTRTAPGTKPGKTSNRGPGGNGRIALVLAGFTGLVIVAIALFAVLFSASDGDGGAPNFTPNDEGLVPVGEQAPPFTAGTVDGARVSVGDGGEARATMLVFFATWCPHCQKEAPVISGLEGQYDGLRVVMAGIDGEDDPGKVKAFVDGYGIEGPALYDPALGPEYGVSGYPTVYVLSGANEVVGAHSGEAPREVYEGWIEEAL